MEAFATHPANDMVQDPDSAERSPGEILRDLSVEEEEAAAEELEGTFSSGMSWDEAISALERTVNHAENITDMLRGGTLADLQCVLNKYRACRPSKSQASLDSFLRSQ